jgi:hypothetical protein
MVRLASLLIVFLFAAIAALVAVQPVGAAKISDVRNTKHNLSVNGPGTVKATTETQICVFCHTPHGAENIPKAPLWNRKLSTATYTPYTSSSIDATAAELAAGPGGSSKLCLSCHDGTLALGSVNVLNGNVNPTIALSGTAAGAMPAASGATTGFTRNLGVNLTNDHPISFTYDTALAGRDGELRIPDGTTVGTRSPGVKPKLPLEAGQMQCSTCHDPHLRETDAAKGSAKFLRVNRFQEQPPTGGVFSESADIICLACHDKAGQTWALSAHANPNVANEVFTSAATDAREFPAGLPVWRASCLSCHDTHTVQGARRLLREGTDSTATPKATGNSAIEETCYQCHAFKGAATNALSTTNNSVPNIKDDFSLSTHMPITDAHQQGSGEVHDIGTGTGAQRGKDFVESPTLLGKGAPANRHVECTDCHNPHRVIKNRTFADNPATPASAGTHNHTAGHTNIASGVLKGGTGVEPLTWSGNAFGNAAAMFELKRGDGGVGASTAAGSAWVTREYQVCLKCHSTYAYNSPPLLGDSGGGTVYGTNGLTQFTDQAMEFQAPGTHRGAASVTDSGAFLGSITPVQSGSPYPVDFQTRNHRSWHPVLNSTGRTLTLRSLSTGTSAWRAPWNANADIGSQTMYCSDCHGSNTAADTVVPSGTNPWGPHGSSNRFLLKGSWDVNSGSSDANTLCFRCHDTAVYNSNTDVDRSAFYNSSRGNLHAYHRSKIGSKLRCTWCHVAVPHGWKNRSFLVNLNDVGPEVTCRQEDRDDLPTNMKSRCVVGQPIQAGTQMRNGPSGNGATSTTLWGDSSKNLNSVGYTNPPYYLNAMLKIRTFAAPHSWSDSNCGSAGTNGNPGNAVSGINWMKDGNENCVVQP